MSGGRQPITVRMYRHGYTKPLPLNNDNITRISWQQGTSSPYESLSISLNYRRSSAGNDFVLPRVNDWIVVWLATSEQVDAGNASARMMASVTTVNKSMVVSKAGSMIVQLEVAAAGWYDLLARNTIHVSPAAKKSRRATLFNSEYWAEKISLPILSTLTASNPGKVLQKVMIPLMLQLFPKSMSGDAGAERTYANTAWVVHNNTRAAKYTYARSVEAVPGNKINGFESTAGPMGSSVQATIQGTFGGDPNLIELFPSLEPAVGTQRIAKIPGGKNDVSKMIGALPVLIYRIRPWRAESLKKFAQRVLGGSVARNVLPDFNSTTWEGDDGEDRCPVVDRDAVRAVNVTYSSADDLNVVTADIPSGDGTFAWIYDNGLPFTSPRKFNPEPNAFPVSDFYKYDLLKAHGVHAYEPNYPFLPHFGDSTSSSLKKTLVTICALGAQHMYYASRFGSGTITCAYSPQVRHGQPVRVQLPLGNHAVEPRSTASPSEAVAYVESVAHQFSVSANGITTATTTIKVSRYLHAAYEGLRNFGENHPAGGVGALGAGDAPDPSEEG